MNASNKNFNLNRPIYLARRDLLLEKSLALFPECLKEQPVRKRLVQIDAVLDCLHSALEPALMAAQSEQAKPLEESLIVFLRLVMGYLQSARAIMEYESQLDNTRGPLWEFIHREGQAASSGFTRSSEQILQDIARLLRMGEPPFQELRKTLVAALTPEERDRYRRAYEDFKAHSQSLGRIRRVQMRPNFLASS